MAKELTVSKSRYSYFQRSLSKPPDSLIVGTFCCPFVG
ncbi:hypothetical protein AVDCRST_MAG94-3586 [uncultured Leptolyngbya sp.]|uniref:Uncharacterized protein n=1 Tax=uncultured Leptolyngbya sp. TaxID=332963 RepID=A0A6J4MQX7_9CYAN|nr:hypothetical protein AVDCRST_MAG94-3586 [uncultured Leptolyngbya sp.]